MIEYLIGKTTNAYELLRLLPKRCKGFEYRVPIDIQRIVECLGVKLVLDTDRSKIVGEVKMINNLPIVGINMWHNEHISCRRFTIAHEIGHLCLHILPFGRVDTEGFKDTKENLTADVIWNIKEYEANNFASQLLMPKDLLKQEAQLIIDRCREKYGKFESNYDFLDRCHDEFLEELISKFKVPKRVLIRRLNKLFDLGIA